MKILIFGGVGFVGLNIAHALLHAGAEVVLFDRSPLPRAAARAFAGLPGRIEAVVADVTDAEAVAAAVGPDIDGIVMGAAITAGAVRDAADPEAILQVNLQAQVPILRAAKAAGVRRVINLSSAAAYGAAGERHPVLEEGTPGDPQSLYALTKWASERVCARLGALWDLDIVSLRLSGVFGPWERATGVRDTLSPQCQILAAAASGGEAILPRPGLRDWTFAPDIAEAVRRVLAAGKLQHRLYNVSTGHNLAALDWGRALEPAFPGFVCRLAKPGEAATIDLHGATDRAPLAAERFESEFGWRPSTDRAASAERLAAWWREHGAQMETAS